MTHSDETFSNLFKVLLKDLSGFEDRLVLVGGWLPWIYTKFIWKRQKYAPIRTSDIDWGIKEKYEKPSHSLQSRFKGDQYRRSSLYSDEPNPYQYSFLYEKEEYPIDFISGEYASPSVLERFTGKNLYISSLDFFDFLLDHTFDISISIDGEDFSLTVPKASAYFYHKAITFIGRGEEANKFGKDLYYLFYILDHLPADYRIEFLQEILFFKEEDPQFYSLFWENLSEQFLENNSSGHETIFSFFQNETPDFKGYILKCFQNLMSELPPS